MQIRSFHARFRSNYLQPFFNSLVVGSFLAWAKSSGRIDQYKVDKGRNPPEICSGKCSGQKIGTQSMNKPRHHVGVTYPKTRIEQAEVRTEQAERRTEQAKTRTEQAEARTEQAETRTEQAKSRAESAETRAEHAEIRTQQAEMLLQRVVHHEVDLLQKISTPLLDNVPSQRIADRKSSLEQLTGRQLEILRLIAEGQNTKQIAATLELSPKTVEYHRVKLMNRLNVHDIPGLVRFALRVGLISPES